MSQHERAKCVAGSKQVAFHDFLEWRVSAQELLPESRLLIASALTGVERPSSISERNLVHGCVPNELRWLRFSCRLLLLLARGQRASRGLLVM